MISNRLRLTRWDIEFLMKCSEQHYEPVDESIWEDPSSRTALVENDRVFRLVMDDRDIVAKISPALYFEILLRQSLKRLSRASHTTEYQGTDKLAIFDSRLVVDLFKKHEIVFYSADLLASFTRIDTYVKLIRVRKGIWKRIRYNDMDIHSLIELSNEVVGQDKFNLYKRIADCCLFISGIFPEYLRRDYEEELRGIPGIKRRQAADYELVGRKFYQLASLQEIADETKLAEVLHLMSTNFTLIKKPLNFISENYLQSNRRTLFDRGC